MSGNTDLLVLCKTSEVDADVPLAAEIGGEAVAVFRVGNSFFVTQNQCTHGPGLLSDGYVEGDVIECPFHQGKFSISSGQPVAPPCTVPLRVWDVILKDENVCVRSQPQSD